VGKIFASCKLAEGPVNFSEIFLTEKCETKGSLLMLKLISLVPFSNNDIAGSPINDAMWWENRGFEVEFLKSAPNSR
jgi:hypothetical protein